MTRMKQGCTNYYIGMRIKGEDTVKAEPLTQTWLWLVLIKSPANIFTSLPLYDDSRLLADDNGACTQQNTAGRCMHADMILCVSPSHFYVALNYDVD